MEDQFDPDQWTLIFAVVGLARGWMETPERDRDFGMLRVIGILILLIIGISCVLNGLRWESALHFVVKAAGSYHLARLCAWLISALFHSFRNSSAAMSSDKSSTGG